MPKIKMFETNLQNSYEQYETIVSGVTQWEDVTVDELKALEYWVTKKNQGVWGRCDTHNIIIVHQLDKPDMKECIADYIKAMKEELQKKEEIKEKRLTAKKKREDKKAAQKLVVERKEYEKLKVKFEK